MKQMKKIITLAMVLAMVMALLVPAVFAEDVPTTGSITITNATKDKEYRLYKILDMTMAGEGDDATYAYKTNSKWQPFLNKHLVTSPITGSAFDPVPVDVGNAIKYLYLGESQLGPFGSEAVAFAVNQADFHDKSVTATADGELIIGDLPLGYYLVYPVGAAVGDADAKGYVVTLGTPHPDVELTIKMKYPTITKTDDKTTAELGETVNYKITGTVPNTNGYTSYTYRITDSLSVGLTLQDDLVVKIGNTVLNKGTDYTCETTILEGNSTTVVIDIPMMDEGAAKYYTGQTIEITYSAIINTFTYQYSSGSYQNNRAKLTYSNDPSSSTSTATTNDIVEKVASAVLRVEKVDGNNKSVYLAGAKFVLKNEAGQFYKYVAATDTEPAKVVWVDSQDDATVKTSTTGSGMYAVYFDGLKDGTYTLVETEPPVGYNKCEDVEVVIDLYNEETKEYTTPSYVTKQVENFSGTLLPSTGGMGTTLFYVLGGIMVLAAVVLLVTKRRMSAR